MSMLMCHKMIVKIILKSPISIIYWTTTTTHIQSETKRTVARKIKHSERMNGANSKVRKTVLKRHTWGSAPQVLSDWPMCILVLWNVFMQIATLGLSYMFKCRHILLLSNSSSKFTFKCLENETASRLCLNSVSYYANHVCLWNRQCY